MKWIIRTISALGIMFGGLIYVILCIILQALPFVLAVYAILWLLGKV